MQDESRCSTDPLVASPEGATVSRTVCDVGAMASSEEDEDRGSTSSEMQVVHVLSRDPSVSSDLTMPALNHSHRPPSDPHLMSPTNPNLASEVLVRNPILAPVIPTLSIKEVQPEARNVTFNGRHPGDDLPTSPISPLKRYNHVSSRNFLGPVRRDSNLSHVSKLSGRSSESRATGSPRTGRRRTATQIFNDVLKSSQRFAPVTVGEEDPPAVSLIVLASCVASKLASTAFLFPAVGKLMKSDWDTELLISNYEREQQRLLPLKEKLSTFLNTNNRILVADSVQAILAVVSSVLYVFESYRHGRTHEECSFVFFHELTLNGTNISLYACQDHYEEGSGSLLWIKIVESVFAVIFALDYSVRFYVAESRLRYFLSLFAMVDLITIVPVFLAWLDVGSNSFGFVRVVRLLRLLRVLKAYRLVGDRNEWTAIKQANILIFTVISLLLVAAGLFQLVEGDGITFGDSVYFMVVTMSTVGYGDISPSTALGKVVMILLIMTAIVLIPVQTRALIDIIGEQPKEMFKNIPGGSKGFVIVAGHHLTHEDVYMFLKEFYHPVHHNPWTPGVIVVSKEPLGMKMRILLGSQRYKKKLRFVLGSLLDNDTLGKIHADEARACFLLATRKEHAGEPGSHAHDADDASATARLLKSIGDREGIDTAAALQTLNFRSFTKYQVQTYCLLNHSAGKAAAAAASADFIVSLDESRLKLMAQSCICPGLSTLVINFVTSFREVVESQAKPKKKKKSKLPDASPSTRLASAARSKSDTDRLNCEQPQAKRADSRQEKGQSRCSCCAAPCCCGASGDSDSDSSSANENDEYKRGMCNLVYEMRVPRQLVDRNFIEAAIAIYMKFEVTILGVIDNTTGSHSPTNKGLRTDSGLSTNGQLNGRKRDSSVKSARFEDVDLTASSGIRSSLQFLAGPKPTSADKTFNFVLNPGHRYRLKDDDLLAVIALDRATCEVCAEYDKFPLDDNDGDEAARLRREQSFYGLAQTASLHLTRRRGPPPHYLAQDILRRRQAKLRFKALVWAIVSLQKFRPVKSSLAERTVLDVNAAMVKHRDYVSTDEDVGLAGPTATASPGTQCLVQTPSVQNVAGFGETVSTVGRERGLSMASARNAMGIPLNSSTSRGRRFSIPAALPDASQALVEIDLQAKIAELTAQLVTKDAQLRDFEKTQSSEILDRSVRSNGSYDPLQSAHAAGSNALIAELKSQVLAKEILLKELVQQVNPNFFGFRRTDWKKEGVFKDHIIVTGGQRNLAQFVRALKRSLCATKTPLKTVLYLAPTPPIAEVWNRVSHYRYFYFIQGDPKVSNDLYRAGLEDASSLVILMSDTVEKGAEVDSDVVFITMAAINLCPVDVDATRARVYADHSPLSDSLRSKLQSGPIRNKRGIPVLRRANGESLFIIAELVSSASVKYFNDFDVLQAARSYGLNAKERMEYRTKTNWEKKLRDVADSEVSDDIEAFSSTHQIAPFYAAGFLISNQMFMPILPQTFYSPSLIRIVEQFMQGSLNQYGSFLGSVDVPGELVGKTYGELFYNMALKMEMVPLGLYRAPCPETKSPLPYVVTNPAKTTVVHEGDKVYVLQSGKDVEEGSDSSGDEKDTSSTSSVKPYKVDDVIKSGGVTRFSTEPFALEHQLTRDTSPQT